MRNSVVLFIFTVVVSMGLSSASHAGMTQVQVLQILSSYGLNQGEQQEILTSLKQNFPADSQGQLAISGVLRTTGMYWALFRDSGNWDMDVNFISPKTHQVVRLPNYVHSYFENGGLKAEIGYKFIFLFIPSGMTLQSLAGAVCGRGLGAGISGLVGVEAGWMPCKNRAQDIFEVTARIGIGGGIMFPRMTFKTEDIK